MSARSTAVAVLLALLALVADSPRTPLAARPQGPSPVTRVRILPAPELRLTGQVDSNSPAMWDLVEGEPRLHVFTSSAGTVRRSEGRSILALTDATDVAWVVAPEQGVWMEAVVSDDAGVWYGYYHNERAGVACGEDGKVLPRIGAARSPDRGATWEDLGPILEAPPDSYACGTTNQYFHGGVGDLSVMLDPDRQFLYVFYSEYFADPAAQGVAMARLAWADRDAPQGRVDVWQEGVWLPPAERLDLEPVGLPEWIYPAGSPLFPTSRSWHDDQGVSDAFWGPSVHWNTYLQTYVMLLNRTRDVQFTQEGIYISFSASLDDPSAWSSPRLVMAGGQWYPQVIALEEGGTDKLAGRTVRLFLSGASHHQIEFLR